MENFDLSNEIIECSEVNIDWSKLDNKTFLISGATGQIGCYLVKVLLERSRRKGLNTRIDVLGRSRKKFDQLFNGYDKKSITLVEQDVRHVLEYEKKVDYVIHLASNTHPRIYATDPIGTVMINILGTYNLLEFAAKNQCKKFLLASSGDIYGDNIYGKELLTEKDCGYIDCNTLRAGYIEGKRASEALCNAYKESKGVDYIIARLCRIYGPTISIEDSKAIAQFLKQASKNEDIVLKSDGSQIFSYLYIFDAVSALLTVLSNGKNGEAYNIADNKQYLSLKQLAETLAEIAETRVVYNKPDNVEVKGASNFSDVRLDASKLYELGWKPKVSYAEGLRYTVECLRERMGQGF